MGVTRILCGAHSQAKDLVSCRTSLGGVVRGMVCGLLVICADMEAIVMIDPLVPLRIICLHNKKKSALL